MAHTKSKLSEIRQAKRLETALKLIELKRGYYVDLRPLVLTEKQANKLLKQVMDAARAHGIKTVFVEPQFPKSSAEAVANGISAKIVIADPLAENLLELYKDMADKLIASFQENS